MSINGKDREHLRDLAKRMAEIAARPVQAERRALWKRHNALDRTRPMILVFPEGAWRELLPEEALVCEDEHARRMERALRGRLFYHDHLRDDTVIEREWIVQKAVSHTGWGLEPRRIPSSDPTGAYRFDPVILTPADLKTLRHPEVIYDEAATNRSLAEARDLFGDVLDVKLKGVRHVGFHLMNLYTHLRGLLEVMQDMHDNPAMLHDAMSFLEEGYARLVRQWDEMSLLDLNNDGTYHASGGVGYTDELPRRRHVARPPSAGENHAQAGAPVPHVGPCDMWVSAEAQELAQVSPEMHKEFSLDYEARLLAPFALAGYGCCEDLTRKMDDVMAVPNMRRISIAPSADVGKCAEKLGGRFIFSWKPQPAHLVGEFDDDKVRRYIRHTLDVTKGCVVEMVLKDTHTCEHHPERFTRWTEIARELVEAY